MNQLVGQKSSGKHFLELRLEPGNIEQLKQGRSIMKRIEDMFPDGIPRRLELYISYSETPVADSRELQQLAEVAIDERPLRKLPHPHCPECKSTIEQLGAWKNDAPVVLIFCAVCGCTLGGIPKP